MRKFFDSRRELVSSGPGSGGGGSSSGSSHAGGNFIGRAFTVGRHQVTVEEIIAEGKKGLQRPDDAICLFFCPFSCLLLCMSQYDMCPACPVHGSHNRDATLYHSHRDNGAVHLCISGT